MTLLSLCSFWKQYSSLVSLLWVLAELQLYCVHFLCSFVVLQGGLHIQVLCWIVSGGDPFGPRQAHWGKVGIWFRNGFPDADL